MEVIRRNWLKIAEYISLVGAIMGAIAAIFFAAVTYAAVLLFLSLWLNLMIRYRWHQMNQEEIIHATITLENLLLDIRKAIAERVEQMKSEIAQMHQTAQNHASHEDIDNLIMAIKQLQGELSILGNSVIPIKAQLDTLINAVKHDSVSPQLIETWQTQLREILTHLKTPSREADPERESIAQAAFREIQRFYQEIADSINELKQMRAISLKDSLEGPAEFSTLTAAVTDADQETWGTPEPFEEPVTSVASLVGQFPYISESAPDQALDQAPNQTPEKNPPQATDPDTLYLSESYISEVAWTPATWSPENWVSTATHVADPKNVIPAQINPQTETSSENLPENLPESLAITQRQPTELQIPQAIPPSADLYPVSAWQKYAATDTASLTVSIFNDPFNQPLASMMADTSPHLDLSYTNLSGVSLTGANLAGATLTQANLCGADLSSADLRGADLRGADLSGANLDQADLEGANLAGANLVAVNLRTADLRGANFCEANLGGQNLSGLNLSHTNFNGANLEAANLIGANLFGSQMIAANLTHVDLTEANLEFANLREANLTGATIERTNFGTGEAQAILTKAIMADGREYEEPT